MTLDENSDHSNSIKLLKSVIDNSDDKRYNEVIEFYPWLSFLLFGYLYVNNMSSGKQAKILSIKSLENYQDKCDERNIEEISNESEKIIIAMTLSLFLFDSKALRSLVSSAERSVAKKVKGLNKSFLDHVSIDEYKSILKRKIKKNSSAVEPIRAFFVELVGRAKLSDKIKIYQLKESLKSGIEVFMKQAARKIEKPDRIFYYWQILNEISDISEMLFDSCDKKDTKFRGNYKWAFPKGKNFKNLNMFWITSMIGLLILFEVLDNQKN